MKTEIPPQNKRRRLLDMSLSETMRLADMLRKMLSFSKPDQEERSVVDINTIIDEILLLHEKQLRENDIKITVALAEGLHPVLASKNQLRQVFLNMISNARDAMPDGGQLSVATDGNSRNVRARISATPAQASRPNILIRSSTPFSPQKRRASKAWAWDCPSATASSKTTGATIQVDSRPGGGTTFTVILPVYQTVDAPTPNR